MDGAVKAKLDALERQYIADALEDWLEENPDADPETSEEWAKERAMVIDEFNETVRSAAAPTPRTASPQKPVKPQTPPKPVEGLQRSAKPVPPPKKPSLSSPPTSKPATAVPAALIPNTGVILASESASVPMTGVNLASESATDETVSTVPKIEQESQPQRVPDPSPHAKEVNDAQKGKDVVSTRGQALTRTAWLDSFDKEGRMVAEPTFKKTVFLGGIDSNARRETWPFLLGMFAFGSTCREREVVQLERRIEYLALKERWQEQLGSASSDMDLPGEDLDDQHQFIFIQAKVNAMRYEINEEAANKAIKAIAKDVPRTDRKGDYFSDDKPHRLQWLNDILVTYAVFHPEVGYAQGMNDVLSMILAVMDHEADAYWCFQNYLSTIQEDFMTKGMMDKLETLVELVKLMDPEFYLHLEKIDAADMVFCHRWLLLSFKREFSFSDATRLFEILCSHHLELSSVEANKARDEEQRGQDLGEDATNTDFQDDRYTFELFVSLAILRTYRDDLMQTGDMADIFTYINGLVGAMNLDKVLVNAETIFFEYCRKSVTKT